MFPILEIRSRVGEEWNDKFTHRIIIAGANGVGKTSLLTLFTGKEMNMSPLSTANYCKSQVQKTNELGKQQIQYIKAKICLSAAFPNTDFRIVNFEAQVLRESDTGGIFDDEPKASQ